MTTAVLEMPVWTPEEIAILRPRHTQALLPWAREHIRLTEGPDVHGDERPLWVPERFAPQPTIVEAMDDRMWSLVVLMTSPQSFGKTQCMHIPALGHSIGERQVSALYVSSSLNLSVTQYLTKIEPAFRADEALAAMIPENRDDAGNRTRRDFAGNLHLHCAGAESEGSLSGFTCPVVLCDDVQAYPPMLGRLGHPADVAFKRSESFPQSMITHGASGTASDVNCWLWRKLSQSTFYCLFLPCPRCSAYQMIEMERMVFEENVNAARTSTRMRCARPECGYLIGFNELEDMLAEHRWVSTPPDADWVLNPTPGGVWIEDMSKARIYPETDRTTTICGFWANALYWPLGKTWGERAAEFLTARQSPDTLKDFRQHVLAIPYVEPPADMEALTPEQLAAGRDDHGYQRGQVPADADVVTLTADVHARFIYYVARAWCRATGSSYLVDAGTLGVHGPRDGETLTETERASRIGHAIREALADLAAMASTGWEHLGHGTRIAPAAVLVDGGYRPDAVGQVVQSRNALLGSRLWHMVLGRAHAHGAGMIWPHQPQRKGPRTYRIVNVDEAKLVLRDLLALPAGLAGSWKTYTNEPLERYWRHLASEEYVEAQRGGQAVRVWRKRQNAGPNHWLDCEVYQVAAALCCKIPLPSLAPVEAVQDAPKTGWFSSRRRSAAGARSR